MQGLVKPPTDNLYKFAAIAGLAIMFFFVWLQHSTWTRAFDIELSQSPKMSFPVGSYQKRQKFDSWIAALDKDVPMISEEDMAELVQLVQKLLSDSLPEKPVPGPLDAAYHDSTELLEYYRFYQSIESWFSTAPQLLQEENFLLLTEDKKCRDEIMRVKSEALSFAEYFQSAEHRAKYTEFDSYCREQEGYFREMSQSFLRRAKVAREYELARYTAVPMIVVGCLFSLFGFVMWYRKVQRFQDEILINECESSKKHIPETEHRDILTSTNDSKAKSRTVKSKKKKLGSQKTRDDSDGSA